MRPFFTLLCAFALTTATIAQDPCAGLHALFTADVNPNEVMFANATSGTGFQTTWSWTFGDGSGSNAEHPVHVYAQPGSYVACLTAISIYEQQGGGLITCADTMCQEVFVPAGGDPCDSLGTQFQWGPGGGQNAVFYSASNGNSDHWLWSFGDGTFSDNGPQGVHEYASPGTYELCLTASYLIPGTQDTCSSTTCQLIMIQGTDPCDSLHACFSSLPMGQQSVMFSNCSTGPGTNLQYTWHFGDGSTSSETSPDHTYTAPGVYSVCLVAYWENCVEEHCQTVLVQGGGNPCDSLSADFMFVPDGGPHTIFYSASNGNGPHWLWSFGDGTYSDNGPQGTHVYPGTGPYELCLTAWQYIPGTQDTCSTTTCHLVSFGGSPCDSSFEAGFQWVDQMNGSAGFYGVSNPAATGYFWSFGDGAHGDGMNPMHVYAQPGEYHVCLNAWYLNPNTQDTCWAEHCEWITVSGDQPCDSLLQAHFVWEPSGQGIIHFQNSSTTNGQAVGYSWTFGDGGQSDGLNPLHTYGQSGQYNVCLTVYALNSPDSCSSTVCQWINVDSGTSPCSELNAGFSVWPGGLSVNLQNTVINPNWSYEWTFGDGHTGTGPSTGHVYDYPGTYLLCLIVGTIDPDTQDSCFADHCQLVTVTSGGNAFCDSLLQAQFLPMPLEQGAWSFSNGTISTHPQSTHYLWTFGDGTSGDGYSPTHVYVEPGVYQVCLTAWMAVPGTSDTCSSTTCHFVEVVVSIAEQAEYAVSAWPQPVEQMLVVEGEALLGDALFTVLDMTGRVVFERNLFAQGRAVLDLSALASGSYVLRIRIAGADQAIRILKR